MSSDFPSIWLKFTQPNKVSTRIAGFFREWNHLGDKTEKSQIDQILKFTDQIDKASKDKSRIIITGDANLCTLKQLDNGFLHKNVSIPLQNCLTRCGLVVNQIGLTYQADHSLPDGSIPSSAIDHVYSSKSLDDLIQINKLPNSSTDHLTVITELNLMVK